MPEQLSLCPAYPASQPLYAVVPDRSAAECEASHDLTSDELCFDDYMQARAAAQLHCVQQRRSFVVLDVHDGREVAYRVSPAEYQRNGD